jgi:hypothetical protein
MNMVVNSSGHNPIQLYFSDFFGVSPSSLRRYGAFNISLLSDLPLFVDPFLLFNSEKRHYRALHDRIIEYLRFLRNKSEQGQVDADLVDAWYRFPEIKQNWLGFAGHGNRGRGLGPTFAAALNENLQKLFGSFGAEKITKGSHLEKLCLIREGVGRDCISDFTNNLILEFLLEYTQTFALKHISPALRKCFAVPKVRFNYNTETWASASYELPIFAGSYVLLTPRDILTKDDTWINRSELIDDFHSIPSAIPNAQLRAQINNYFRKALPKRPGKKDEREAAFKTIQHFPELIDFYIKLKEDTGDRAKSLSAAVVELSEQLYLRQFGQLPQLLSATTPFYNTGADTYEEAHQRVQFLKDVIENKGGHRIFYIDGQSLEREEDLHILFRLTWYATVSDVTREANDGRGPVDFKVSRGRRDKTLVEFKLAKNSHLQANLQHQAEIYQKASDAHRTIKVIFYFSPAQRRRVDEILKRLKLTTSRDIVLVDARKDNKPSGSKARSLST